MVFNYHGKHDLGLLTDLYQLTMIQGYYYHSRDEQVVFDMFFRKHPFNSGYTLFAGLETLIAYITNFRITADDIAYLKTLDLFKDDFLAFLKNLTFTLDLYAVPEGSIVFPNEPLIRVHGPIIEVQLLETILLNIINYQSLIATKTARIVEAAKGRPVLEFGLRRAQGFDGAISAGRASYIGGAAGTSNVLAGKYFNIPIKGTMAHSWVMSFDCELESFEKYAQIYPEHTIILVDTYDTLHKGLPAAVKVLKALKQKGIKTFGIRLDSGDLLHLSKEARRMLDAHDLGEAKIAVSNDLDEYSIGELIEDGACIDLFGVGTRLVTAHGDPALTGVYKLAGKRVGDRDIPCLKISDDPVKTTIPGVKNILRLYRGNTPCADVLHLSYEQERLLALIKDRKPLSVYPLADQNNEVFITGYDQACILLKPILKAGTPVGSLPALDEIKQSARANLNTLDASHKQLVAPVKYPLYLTKELVDTGRRLIDDYMKKG